MTTGESTILANTPGKGQVFNWAFGAVLEPYYVISCDDYPPNEKLTIKLITVFDQNSSPVVDPQWGINVNKTDTPQCKYGVARAPRTVTLDH